MHRPPAPATSPGNAPGRARPGGVRGGRATRLAGRAAAVVATMATALLAPALLAGLAPAALPQACAAAAGQVHVGLVVDYGTVDAGLPATTPQCVSVADKASGFDVLIAAGHRFTTDASGLVCSIDGYPASGCGQAVNGHYRFWSYWKGGTEWDYASVGPGTSRMRDGSVEGWHFAEGDANASVGGPRSLAGQPLPPAEPPAGRPGRSLLAGRHLRWIDRAAGAAGASGAGPGPAGSPGGSAPTSAARTASGDPTSSTAADGAPSDAGATDDTGASGTAAAGDAQAPDTAGGPVEGALASSHPQRSSGSGVPLGVVALVVGLVRPRWRRGVALPAGRGATVRIGRHPATRRLLHPGAWWLWAGGLAAAAMRTTNPFLLALIIAVVAYVVSARRSPAPWARSFGSFVRLAVIVVVFRMVIQILVGQRVPGTTLFTLPSVDLPSWMAGVSLGGPVTAEALVASFNQGLRLATVLICFGAVNSLCSPYRMLRALPASLYEAGVAITVALSFAPQAVIEAGRIREARRLRGRPTRGVAAIRGLALPVLEGALDRSVALAASMDSRGYGRRVALAPRVRVLASLATGVGMLAVAVGLYGVLDAGAPRALGLPVLGVGAVVLAASLFVGGRRAVRTRYRPDPWRAPEWVVSLSGAAALAGMVAAARVAVPGALEPPMNPLAWPALPWVAVAGIVVALLPSVVAPRPPTLVPEVPTHVSAQVAAPGSARASARPGEPVAPGGPQLGGRQPGGRQVAGLPLVGPAVADADADADADATAAGTVPA